MGLCVLSTVLLCGAFMQRRELDELRGQRERLNSKAQASQSADATVSLNEQIQTEGSASASQPSPSLELLRLRGEVARLARRRDELAPIGAENTRLQEQLAMRATNGPVSGGYIHKRQAKYAGYNSPESTLQTFLWAIQNKNYEAWRNTLAPRLIEHFRDQDQRTGLSAEGRFHGFEELVGLGIVSKERLDAHEEGELPNGVVGNGAEELLSMQVQIAPDIPPQQVIFCRIGGEWKMIWPEMMH